MTKFSGKQYWKMIPAPSCADFMAIMSYAEKALKGAGE